MQIKSKETIWISPVFDENSIDKLDSFKVFDDDFKNELGKIHIEKSEGSFILYCSRPDFANKRRFCEIYDRSLLGKVVQSIAKRLSIC